MVYFVVGLCYAFELLAQMICLNKFYEKKHNNKVLLYGSGIALHIVCYLLYFATYNINIGAVRLISNSLTYFLIFFAFFIANYKAPKVHYVLCSIFAVFSMCITETLTTIILDAIFTTNSPGRFNNLYDLLLPFISKGLYLIVLLAIVWLINKIQFNTNYKRIGILMMLPAVSIASLVVLLGMYYDALNQSYYVKFLVVIIFVFFLTIVEFIYIYFKSQKQQEELHLLQTEKLQYQLDNTYLKLLENQNEEMHILTHDIKNHLSTIGAMNNIDDVQNYVQTVYSDYTSINLAKSSNKMIDIILYKYSMICKGHNVDFVIEAKTANLSYIEESQLSSLLNNLLDNAVEAAKNSKDKFVEMAIRKEHNFDVLTVINSCDSQPDLTKSTKHDFKNHGYGTKIIKRIVSKNNGEFDCRFDSENSKFIITIIFPNKQGE